ncbi:MAG: hypothetical protein EOO00_03905, partial [Chitinophagaceae bacterium]
MIKSTNTSIKLFTFVSAVMLLFNHCKKPGCAGKGGSIATLSRKLDAFNHLLVSDNINVTLVQGDKEEIEITAPGNILPNITTNITQNVLTIANNTGCRWMRDASEKINVRLYFKELVRLDYQGSGLIDNADTLRLPSLHIESVNGAGEINLALDNTYTGVYVRLENASVTLRGRSDVCFTYTNNRGITDMRDFIVRKMTIDYSGFKD